VDIEKGLQLLFIPVHLLQVVFNLLPLRDHSFRLRKCQGKLKHKNFRYTNTHDSMPVEYFYFVVNLSQPR
jgi:hypothetical protein